MLQVGQKLSLEDKQSSPVIFAIAETGENSNNIRRLFELTRLEQGLEELREIYSEDAVSIIFCGIRAEINIFYENFENIDDL